MCSYIDNKYFFETPRSTLSELRKKGTVLQTNTNITGEGTVAGSLTKIMTKDLLKLIPKCINELQRPESMFNVAPPRFKKFMSGLKKKRSKSMFNENVLPDPVFTSFKRRTKKRKATFPAVNGRHLMQRKMNTLVSKRAVVQCRQSVQTLQIVDDYYKTLQMHTKRGNVGLMPAYYRQGHKLQNTILMFQKSPAYDLLCQFSKFLDKKK